MKVTLPTEGFVIKPCMIAGEECHLVTPQHIGTQWSRENLVFRSSIWNKNGEPVSLGFKKFTNFGENPEIFPDPTSLDNVSLIEKIDGSTLIVSRYKGQLIVRTRGTENAEIHESGFEIPILKQKYPKAFDSSYLAFEDFSLLFEWVGSNRIVIDYGREPDIYLIGCVDHKDYSYLCQEALDVIARNIEVKRPKYYHFDTMEQMLKAVEVFKGIEGICLYFDNDQQIKKAKGLEYLMLHRFKENATLDNTIDLFFEFDMCHFEDFRQKLIEKFDYECFKMVKDFASQICTAFNEVQTIVYNMKMFVLGLEGLSRKDAALKILNQFKENNQSSFVFTLLDGKILDKVQLKKLLYQVLK